MITSLRFPKSWAYLLVAIFSIQSPHAQSTQQNQVTVTGTCSVVIVASPESRVRVDGCGKSPRDVAAFKSLETRLNSIIETERVQGTRLNDLVAAVNLWFPVLSVQLESVQSEIQKSIAEASKEILTAVRNSKEGADLATAFLSVAERKISGTPLSECNCDFPTDHFSPYKTFQSSAPNSVCLSGAEKTEACVSIKVSFCRTKYDTGYPPFRRVCQ